MTADIIQIIWDEMTGIDVRDEMAQAAGEHLAKVAAQADVELIERLVAEDASEGVTYKTRVE